MINSELETIKRKTLQNSTPQPNPTPTPDLAEVNKVDESEGNNPIPLTDISTFYDEVLVAFDKYKEIPIYERKETNVIKLTNENKDKLVMINDALTKFIDNHEEITLTKLNALHYSVAIVVAGEAPPLSEKDNTQTNPYQSETNLKIEKIRKGIGRLTAALKSGKVTKKVKTLCKDKSIETTLVTYRM